MTREEFRDQTEDMILMMAEIVHENRALRKFYNEALEENKALKAELRESYAASEEFNKRVPRFALESTLPMGNG